MEERSLAQRLAAGVALVVLLVAGLLSAWWILTDRADFRSLADRPRSETGQRDGGRARPDPGRAD